MAHDSDSDDLHGAAANAPPSADPSDDEADESLQSEGFEEGDAYETDMGDESLSGGDLASDAGERFGANLAQDEDVDRLQAGTAAEGDALDVWNAFEEEIADSLDARDTDDFIGRILGALRRAASAAAPAAQAAVTLARVLGAPQAGNASAPAEEVAGTAGGLAERVSQLIGNGFDDLEAFDAAADLYIDEGVDEALPAAVALGARVMARGLGLRNVAQMSVPQRRALVRAIATAARHVILGGGPQAVRALPRMGQAVARTARRRRLPPAGAAQAVQRTLPRTARNVARNPRLARRLAAPANRPLARPSGIGRGMPGGGSRTHRFTFSGPVTLTIRRAR